VCAQSKAEQRRKMRREKTKKKALSVCVFDAKNIALANNVCVFVFVWV
jgi:hypothetical protein